MRLLLIVCLAASFCVTAQDTAAWESTTDLPGINMNGLSDAQKGVLLKVLREYDCSCGCGMKLAECRVKDPACSFSKGLSDLALKFVWDGKKPEEIVAALKASPLSHGPAEKPILEAPVLIPTAGAPTKGPQDARVTLIEFSDFECPYCRVAVGQVDALMTLYPKDIRLIYKQFPLSMHPHARLASAAALAANEQGKFWQMHDQLFANSRDLSQERILAVARQLGLDMTRFTADLKSPRIEALVNTDLKDGENAAVQGTPAFFINGKLYNGPMEVAKVKPLIEAELRPVNASK